MQLFLCDYCTFENNDRSEMANHLKEFHANSPRRFIDAYRKLKKDVDARVARVKRPAPADSVQNDAKKPALTDIRLRSPEPEATRDVSAECLRCLVCSTTVKNKSDFDWHLADEHPQFVKYKCGHCDVLTSSKRSLKDHMVEEHEDKSTEYSMVRNLPPDLDPFRAKTSNNDKTCGLCSFASPSLALLNQHMESEHLQQVR